MALSLDIAAFRASFPAYADETKYPDDVLETYYTIGKCYVKDNNCVLGETCRARALDLMLAHLLYIKDLADSGNKAVNVQSATEGQVSVSLEQSPTTDMFSYWLNTSNYGQQVLALLDVASVGGSYIGGSMERQGFRKAGGGF